MTESVEVPLRDFQMIMLSNFRYALGIQTYYVGVTVEYLIKWWDKMPTGYKEQIHNDIKHAIEHSMAGHDCDVAEWKKLLELPL